MNIKYARFKSQLNSSEPIWRCGRLTVHAVDGQTDTLNGTGDLWVPHVYRTNQNPGDTIGAI